MTSEGSGQNRVQLVGGEGKRVGFHTARASGGFDDYGSVGGREAVGGEARYRQSGDDVFEPVQGVASGGLRAAGEESTELVEAGQRGVLRGARAEGAKVDGERGNEERGADGSVRGRKHAADGAGETVDGAEAGVGEGKAAVEAGEGQVGASGVVAAVFHGEAKRAGGATDAVDAEGVGERIGAGREVGLDELGEGVETGGCGYGGRQ